VFLYMINSVLTLFTIIGGGIRNFFFERDIKKL
jgi:hypothetical protein